MRTHARSLLVWIVLPGSLSFAQPQTRFIDAFPTKGDGRPALLASALPADGGAMTLVQLAGVLRTPVRPGLPPRVAPPAASPRVRGESGRPPALVVPIPLRVPEAYRRTFRILGERPELTDRYDELILRYSLLNGLNPRLVKSIIAAESEFSPIALSPRGARGLMQIVPPTAEEMGARRRFLSDPEENIRAGTAYLALLYRAAWKKFGLGALPTAAAPIWVDQRVIAAYHAGPRYLSASRWLVPTRSYTRKVLLFYQSKITDVRRAPERRRSFPVFPLAPTAGLMF